MRESLFGEDIPEYPEWLERTDTATEIVDIGIIGVVFFYYTPGSWTLLNNIIIVLSPSGNLISYRDFFNSERYTNCDWHYIRMSTKEFKADPYKYLMEEML